jgi:hypothetical protein
MVDVPVQVPEYPLTATPTGIGSEASAPAVLVGEGLVVVDVVVVAVLVVGGVDVAVVVVVVEVGAVVVVVAAVVEVVMTVQLYEASGLDVSMPVPRSM